MAGHLPRYLARVQSFVTLDDDQETPYVWVGVMDMTVTLEASWPGQTNITARMALSKIAVPMIRQTSG